jgi:hypothetical protein
MNLEPISVTKKFKFGKYDKTGDEYINGILYISEENQEYNFVA